MRRYLLAVLLLAATATAPVTAEEHEAVKGGKPGTNVDMPYLMAPMKNEDGKLAGYAYIATRLTATSDAFALDVREKLAFLQDAFVRDINMTAVTLPGSLDSVDVAGLEARLLIDAKRVIGAAKVKTITVCTVQIASLHPKQTPAAPQAAEDAAKGINKSRCAS